MEEGGLKGRDWPVRSSRRGDRAALRFGQGEEGRRAGQGAWWLRQLLLFARLSLQTSDGSQIAEYHTLLASKLKSEALLPSGTLPFASSRWWNLYGNGSPPARNDAQQGLAKQQLQQCMGINIAATCQAQRLSRR
jgi:hypothetical protein